MARFRSWRPRRRVPTVVGAPGTVLPGGAFTLGTPSAGPVVPTPEPAAVPEPEDVRASAPDAFEAEPAEPLAATEREVLSGPRVGLVFGDGTHVVLDPSDPRAGRFAALADELNR